MKTPVCPVCASNQKLKHHLRFDVYECPSCKLLSSDAEFDHSFTSNVQVGTREIGLQNLRNKNFRTIIDNLKRILPNKDISGLEIGSGNGWWLKTCKDEGIKCAGIEPEKTYAHYHQEQNLDVHYGFYPDLKIPGQDQYDFIIFNDVFEHIPNIGSLVSNLYKDLKDSGTLIINIPVRTGFFYRTAVLLNSLGISSYLERMWQFHFHSPHMNYFNDENLQRLLQQHGFSIVQKTALETLDYSGLKERISTDKAISKTKAALLTTALKLIKPVVNSSNPDIKVFFFKKKG